MLGSCAWGLVPEACGQAQGLGLEKLILDGAPRPSARWSDLATFGSFLVPVYRGALCGGPCGSSLPSLKAVKCERYAKFLTKLDTALAFWSSRVRKVREWCPIFIQIEYSACILEPLGNSEGCKVLALCQIPYKIEHSARTLKAQGALRSHSGGLGRAILDNVDEIRVSRKNR